MFTTVIVIVTALVLTAMAGLGKLCRELEELNRRSQEYSRMMDEFEEEEENETKRRVDL